MSKYNVGQIVFVLSQSDMSLAPVLISEEHVKRTIDGEEVTYIVDALVSNGVSKRFPLNFSKYEVFDNIGIARDHLVKNAVSAIEALCEVAVKKAEIFGERKKHQEKNSFEKLDEVDVQEEEYVLLENGKRVKINLPQGI